MQLRFSGQPERAEFLVRPCFGVRRLGCRLGDSSARHKENPGAARNLLALQ
jgi:hypothetical protein